MRNEKQETIADIIAEKRKRIEEMRHNLSIVPIRREEQLAEIESIEVEVSRLEAAMEREHHFADGSKMGGNTAAMRGALVIAKKAICNHARANHTCDSLAWENSTINANCGDILCGHRDLCEAKTAIQKALALPPRNCDVGTPEEQARRMDVYCSMHGKDESGCYRCEECKLMRVDRCELAWAQMPYEEGGAK